MVYKLKKRTRSIVRTTVTVFLLAEVNGLSIGQHKPSVTVAPFERVSTLFDRHVDALGRRGRENGKEQTIYTGEFVDAVTGQRLPVEIIHQLPGLVRLEGFRPGRSAVSFDGRRPVGVLTRTDEILLEMFTTDTAEAMLSSLQRNSAVRFLGARFGPDPKVAPNYTGPRYDLYEVTAPIPSRSDRLVRIKVFYFDSDTGLLHKASYQDHTISPSPQVESRFSDWRSLSGSAYPGRIERFEDGRLIFSLTIASVVSGPRVDTERFR